jgi:DedD protein
VEVRLKERLIGALVVVAVAVLVLPWILDDDKGEADFSSKIPPAPPAPAARAVDLSQPRPLDEAAFDDSIIAAETSVTSTEALPAVSETTAVAQTTPAETAPSQTTAAQANPGQANTNQTNTNPPNPDRVAAATTKIIRPVPVEAGFVIQLGTFSNRENAERLVQTLRAQKFAAYSKMDNRADPALVRVMVGPMTKREQADAQLARVRTLSGQNAIVVAYDPLKH